MNTTLINEQETIYRVILKKFPDPGKLFFIQVGSNDGVTLDPIHDYIKNYSWSGVLIEPVPYLFRKLLQTYKNTKGLFFENVAIDKQKGMRKFYLLKENSDPEMPFWYNLLGSFKKDVIYKHKIEIPGFDKYFTEEDVRCLTLNDIIGKYGIDKIDIIHIDTEGYDYEIIRQIPFDRLYPAIILYEHVHLTEEDNEACRELLEKHHYSLVSLAKDTIAFLKEDNKK